MPEDPRDRTGDQDQSLFGPPPPGQPTTGAGYALFQLAKALTTEAQHPDPATRERAGRRAADWNGVFNAILSGRLAVGTNTPLEGVPAWVTLRVITGGFATGELLAGGPLQLHEIERLVELPPTPEADARRVLNAYYLTEAGQAELLARLQTGKYDVGVPEEGALLVVTWLAHNGHPAAARELLEWLGPWFAQLRFYPIPTSRPRRSGSRVFVQNVTQTVASLQRIRPNPRILAQKEAVCVWTPLYDRAVQLFLETVAGEPPSLRCNADGNWERSANDAFPVQGGWPCQHYPDGWAARALALLKDYELLRRDHQRCGRPEDPRDNFAQLREYLRRCAQDPAGLQGRDVGRIRQILACYLTKRGAPESPRWQERRAPQKEHAGAPTFQELAAPLVARLQAYPPEEGLDDVGPVTQPVSEPEAEAWDLPAGTPIPEPIQHKVERCLRETVDVLVERGLITSGEMLAQVLPQMTAGIRSANFADPALRRLYAAIYAAFRRRRSLLLLDLRSQVKIEDLPWVRAIEPFRQNSLSARELARQTLEEVALLAIASFPYAILPNKLLQELTALAKAAELDLPLVEEVAADIFMGEFSGKFLEVARRARSRLQNSLYSTYYSIDYAKIEELQDTPPTHRLQFLKRTKSTRSSFASLCARRAGVSIGGWDPATNGMIIEQQQILTTQNLAVLFTELHLADALRDRLEDLARQCFEWTCARLQVKTDRWHARLIQIKNAAYAWRQMIFYLSLLPEPEVTGFLVWAEEHLNQQPGAFRQRFYPALLGLMLAADGHLLESDVAQQAGAQRFLGWSKAKHWLHADV